MTEEHTDDDGRIDRRTYLAGAATATVGLSGCLGFLSSDDSTEGDKEVLQIGSGRRVEDLGGTKINDLPDLEGELHIYSGRNEFLVGELIRALEDWYDDFSAEVRYGGSTDLVNTIIEEGSGTPADVFYSVNSGSLGSLADAGRARPLSDTVREMVSSEFRTDSWIGTSGRIRTVPYNSDSYSASDMPSEILAYENFDGNLGWAPGYGSCQAFVTALRILEGDDRTRQWLENVVGNGIRTYPNEFQVCEAINDGEIDAGFTNHYYIQRVRDGAEDSSIGAAFTSGDAGSVFNVAGGAVVDETDDPDLSENFVRHLLSANAQNYFATETFEYPMTGGVPPVGDFPTIDELEVPDIDLTQLSDLGPTVDMMRDVGINI